MKRHGTENTKACTAFLLNWVITKKKTWKFSEICQKDEDKMRQKTGEKTNIKIVALWTFKFWFKNQRTCFKMLNCIERLKII